MASSWRLARPWRNASWTRASTERGSAARIFSSSTPRLRVLAGIHERGGEEVARPEVGGLDRDGVAEGRHGAIPLLLLVVDRAELDPDARVARRGLRQRLDLLLRLLEAAEPDQHVAQPLDEGDVLRVGLQRLPVDLERLFRLLARLVHEAERHPRRVHVGVELDRALEARDRLVPLLALDGHPSEQVLGLGRAGLDRDQTQQHRPRLVELLQLDVLLGEGDVGVGRAGRQLDGLLELALGVGEAALTPEDVGEREMGRRVAGLERDRLVRRLDGLGRLVGARQPLGELHPQRRRVGIAVDGLAERGDGVLDPAGAGVHLGDRVEVVRGGARVADLRGRRLGRRAGVIGGGQGLHRRAA